MILMIMMIMIMMMLMMILMILMIMMILMIVMIMMVTRSLGTPGYHTPALGGHITPSYKMVSSIGGQTDPMIVC